MAVASAFLAPTALVTRGLGTLRLRARHPHSPCPAKAGGHWLCWSGPPARWSQGPRAGFGGVGVGEKQVRGQKFQIPIPLSAACPLPGPTGSPDTCLTSWRRRGWGGLGSRHCRNRLRTVLGHLQGEGECQTSAHLLGVSIQHRFPLLISTPTCTTTGL